MILISPIYHENLVSYVSQALDFLRIDLKPHHRCYHPRPIAYRADDNDGETMRSRAREIYI